METRLIICLLLTAIWVFVVRNYPKIEGLALGFFAGLMMVLLCLLMPSVAKGIMVTQTLSVTLLTTETLIQGMGWLVVFFPVPVFFLAYLHHFPMKIFTLFISVSIFASCYSTILQLVVFQSVWTTILLNSLVFLAVFLTMFGVGWAIRGCRCIITFLVGSADDEAAQGMKGTKGYH